MGKRTRGCDWSIRGLNGFQLMGVAGFTACILTDTGVFRVFALAADFVVKLDTVVLWLGLSRIAHLHHDAITVAFG